MPDSLFHISCPSRCARPRAMKRCLPSATRVHGCTPAAAGGESRAKTTLFARLHDPRDRESDGSFHTSALKRQGKADSTIDVYARAVRRVAQFWDCCPDRLTQVQLEGHFDALVASHSSWSTVKIERNGLQFFWEDRDISLFVMPQ